MTALTLDLNRYLLLTVRKECRFIVSAAVNAASKLMERFPPLIICECQPSTAHHLFNRAPRQYHSLHQRFLPTLGFGFLRPVYHQSRLEPTWEPDGLTSYTAWSYLLGRGGSDVTPTGRTRDLSTSWPKVQSVRYGGRSHGKSHLWNWYSESMSLSSSQKTSLVLTNADYRELELRVLWAQLSPSQQHPVSYKQVQELLDGSTPMTLDDLHSGDWKKPSPYWESYLRVLRVSETPSCTPEKKSEAT